MSPELRKLLEEYIEKGDGSAILDLLAAENNGKFAAKLTFEQRCEVLALRRRGITREIISKLYGIDRRTVTHIQNPLSKHYKNVREEENRMGTDNFLEKYMNDTLTKETVATALALEDGGRNNKQSNKRAGLHMMRNQMCDYDHRVIIQWVEDEKEPGWYFKDLDGAFPDMWTRSHNGESMKNSQACYDAALLEICDKLM